MFLRKNADENLFSNACDVRQKLKSGTQLDSFSTIELFRICLPFAVQYFYPDSFQMVVIEKINIYF